MLKYWKSYCTKNGLTYSCDMIRFSLEFFEEGLKYVMRYISDISRLDVTSYPSNFGDFKYRNLFVIDYGFSTMSVGLNFNGVRKSDSLKGFIEFNPNKCCCEQLFQDVSYIIGNCFKWNLVRWDLAVDIPVKRELLYLPKDQRIYSLKKVSNTDKTEYLGSRNNVGFVKLYNKTIESNLDYDLTRLEVTMASNLNECLSYIPHVYIRGCGGVMVCDNLSKRDMVLIELLQKEENPDFYLKRLNFRYREKIEPYITGDDLIDIEPWYIEQLLNDIYREFCLVLNPSDF